MRRAARVDANQQEIVNALRAVGASIEYIYPIGHGCPDVMAGYRGRTWLLEIKGTRGTLTDDEATWHATWRGQVAIVRSAEEALAAIGAL